MDGPDHRLGLDPDEGGVRRGAGRRQIDRLAAEAPFADEAARPQHPDHALLALARHDAELDAALLEVIDGIAFAALAEDVGLAPVGRDRPADADRGQELFGVEVFRQPGSDLSSPARPEGLYAVPWPCFGARPRRPVHDRRTRRCGLSLCCHGRLLEWKARLSGGNARRLQLAMPADVRA